MEEGKSPTDDKLKMQQENLVSAGKPSRMYDVHQNIMKNQHNDCSSMKQMRKRKSLEKSFNMSSEQRLQSSNKYFKNQNGEYKDASNTLDSANVCLSRGSVLIKANQIETYIPCDVENTTQPRQEFQLCLVANLCLIFILINKSIYCFFQHQRTQMQLHMIKSKEFAKVKQISKQPRPPPSFMAQLSPFHQGLIDTFGKLFCLREYNINCFTDPSSKTSSPSISALAENGDLNYSSLSSPCTTPKSNHLFNNSHPVVPNKTNQAYFEDSQIPHKNSNSDEALKKL
ncbi:unnamed protein product [Moneuplotes crassus]|uniref:Uncharacterized protein n=1 Tax=Euplotes crassus TaxID=5936 RepID=A0AAD1X843_EUPCR|nr:unnamed protein product [Moneuplotes crassus]